MDERIVLKMRPNILVLIAQFFLHFEDYLQSHLLTKLEAKSLHPPLMSRPHVTAPAVSASLAGAAPWAEIGCVKGPL